MNKSICFVANYNKTTFFIEIAKQIKVIDATINIFWITVSESRKIQIEENFPSSSIIYLPFLPEENCDLQNDEYFINEIIYGDRTLRHQKVRARNYLNRVAIEVKSFFRDNNIEKVFGELTWAHEILIKRVCEKINKCIYLNPHTIRIPSDRFAFFLDESQSVFYERSEKHIDPYVKSMYEPKKPYYLSINDKKLKNSKKLTSRMNRVINYFTMRNVDKKDPTMIKSRWTSFFINVKEEINKDIYAISKKFLIKKFPEKENIITIFLHKQPEASIDVVGRYYEDQYANIVNIWKRLPNNYSLVIKEHSNAVGDRGFLFYKKLSLLPNLYIVDEGLDSYDIIKKSKFVVTVSGTVAYEAALMGIQSLTFAKCFFNKFSLCRQLSLDDLANINFAQFNSEYNYKNDEIIKYFIHRNTYNGLISDPISNKKCMDSENIKKVAYAFYEAINFE